MIESERVFFVIAAAVKNPEHLLISKHLKAKIQTYKWETNTENF